MPVKHSNHMQLTNALCAFTPLIVYPPTTYPPKVEKEKKNQKPYEEKKLQTHISGGTPSSFALYDQHESKVILFWDSMVFVSR